jgi:hypothetical protein
MQIPLYPPTYVIPPIPAVGRKIIKPAPRAPITPIAPPVPPKPAEVRAILLEEEVKSLRASLESFVQAITDRDQREMGIFAESVQAAAVNLQQLATFTPAPAAPIEIPPLDLSGLTSIVASLSLQLEEVATTLKNLPAPVVNIPPASVVLPEAEVDDEPLSVDYERNSSGMVVQIVETYTDKVCRTIFERDSRGAIKRELHTETPRKEQ